MRNKKHSEKLISVSHNSDLNTPDAIDISKKKNIYRKLSRKIIIIIQNISDFKFIYFSFSFFSRVCVESSIPVIPFLSPLPVTSLNADTRIVFLNLGKLSF